ncbi:MULTISPECIES: type II toxin-antitoxin system RelE/ParE family toxin [Thiomicrorhabdus]|uniref:Type II toxin-antitoxin system RelE/ParE family toxin n=1 Tax=Thiomicrorhabdus heinhorstiae TaxID=2748010 RepID=A0ABS0BXF2_9GAMM|nr:MULTISPECIES: type II toxin-antitoxin system RelE/ParE family toxin [Thiomicrorhabdus]MBF6058470.1 type II toxin-antitoxin system RelE/ParE family toxin [Thiomicrorhabdus heinhorstiae]
MKIQKFWLDGFCPFDESLNQIKDKHARARILTRLRRLELGNRGDFKNIEGNLYELRIDVGKGWRVYYQQQGNDFVLLYLTGNKATQSKDIEKVKGWIK